jgi:hypothetical protein
VIADNATGKGSAMARGAARRGELILSGLLRCGHCGRKMYVGYGKSGRYYCQGANVNHGNVVFTPKYRKKGKSSIWIAQNVERARLKYFIRFRSASEDTLLHRTAIFFPTTAVGHFEKISR